MELRIDIVGYKNEIVVTAVPKRFVHKIYKHCLGKNNTPYFANNCFKGILYFDEELAGKFAEAVNYEWTGWQSAKRLYHHAAYCFEDSLKITAHFDGEHDLELYPSKIQTAENPVRVESFLPDVKKDEVLILMGSVDKGTQHFTLNTDEAEFNPSRLSVSVDTFTDFNIEEPLITAMSYGGTNLTPSQSESKGRRMLEPRLFSAIGRELDVSDFPPAEVPGL